MDQEDAIFPMISSPPLAVTSDPHISFLFCYLRADLNVRKSFVTARKIWLVIIPAFLFGQIFLSATRRRLRLLPNSRLLETQPTTTCGYARWAVG